VGGGGSEGLAHHAQEPQLVKNKIKSKANSSLRAAASRRKLAEIVPPDSYLLIFDVDRGRGCCKKGFSGGTPTAGNVPEADIESRPHLLPHSPGALR